MPVEPTLWRDVACPFCGLACDDLEIERDGDRLKLRAGGCARSRTWLEQPPPQGEPQIGGQPVALAAAVARAAELLRDSRLPLFAGLGTDVDGMRAVMQLADRTGGVLDHSGSDALFRNLRVLQDAGWVATTLSEVRNHMDLLLLIGNDPSDAFPRFMERCVHPPETMFADRPAPRHVVRIGPPAAAPTAGGDTVTELACAIERLPEVAAALRCLVNQRPLVPTEVAGLPAATLHELAERLRAARYGVIAWAAADFDFPGAELTLQALCALVQDLNRTTRCVVLPLTGNDNITGVNQVCGWQSGYPLRTGFGSGGPEHDPYRFAARRLIEAKEADALVWISALHDLPPSAEGVPAVVIATPGTRSKMASPPEVFIPVGSPGREHGGGIFRMDAVVMLRLKQLRDSGLPSVAHVIAEIDRALGAGGRPR